MWEIVSKKRGTGRHDIGLANSLIAHASRLDQPRPSSNKGYAVPPFPLIPLHSSPWTRSIVILVASHRDGSRDLWTIIAGYDYQRVLRHA